MLISVFLSLSLPLFLSLSSPLSLSFLSPCYLQFHLFECLIKYGINFCNVAQLQFDIYSPPHAQHVCNIFCFAQITATHTHRHIYSHIYRVTHTVMSKQISPLCKYPGPVAACRCRCPCPRSCPRCYPCSCQGFASILHFPVSFSTFPCPLSLSPCPFSASHPTQIRALFRLLCATRARRMSCCSAVCLSLSLSDSVCVCACVCV